MNLSLGGEFWLPYAHMATQVLTKNRSEPLILVGEKKFWMDDDTSDLLLIIIAVYLYCCCNNVQKA